MTAPRVYLDYNASAPLLPQAREAMLSALAPGANASSVHADGRRARQLVEHARRRVAALCGARAEHVTFTSGATEAANWLLSPEWRMGRAPLHASRLYVGATEHPCILSGGRFASDGISILPVHADGRLDLDALRAALAGHDASAGLPLIAVQMANNETGVIQSVAEIAAIVKAAGGVLVVDAVQAAGRIKIDISSSCGDFLILSSHKIGGPQGAGAIVGVADLMMPAPLLRGGGQEKGHRAGTENVAAIAGFGAAAEIAATGIAAADGLASLRDRAEMAVAATFPEAVIHGAGAPRLANTLFFSIPGVKAETLQIALDLAGISTSAGSACSSGRVGPSHVLAAMGVGENASALRVSMGHATTVDDVDRFAAALAAFADRLAGGNRAA